MNSLESWLQQLIVSFREYASDLTPEARRRISNLDDLSSPCQVDVFWFQSERLGLDYQLFLFRRSQDRPDLEIEVHGPISLHRAIDELERFLSDEKWDRKLASDNMFLIEDEDRTLRGVVESLLLSELEQLKNYIISHAFSGPRPPAFTLGKTIFPGHSFTWSARGDIRSQDPQDMARKMAEIRVAEAPRPNRKTASVKQAPAPRLKAYGAYFYPPIWIGEPPKKTFREKAQKQLSPGALEHFSVEYKGNQLVVQQDGLLAVVGEDRVRSLNVLNEIMGVALVLGLPCFVTREQEVVEMTMDSETHAVSGSTMSLGSERNRYANEWMAPSRLTATMPTTFLLSKEELVDLLSRAARIAEDENVRKALPLLLESYTHLMSAEYAQSFVMGWTVVEMHIASVWKRFLEDKRANRKRRDKLEGPSWTTDYVLEALNLAGELDDSDYSRMMALKSKRNSILHKGRAAAKDDADECFGAAGALVEHSVQRLGELVPIKYQQRRFGLRD